MGRGYPNYSLLIALLTKSHEPLSELSTLQINRENGAFVSSPETLSESPQIRTIQPDKALRKPSQAKRPKDATKLSMTISKPQQPNET